MNHNTRKSINIVGKMTHRRSRTPNWSMDEKQYLLELIKERKEVVIAKNNNGPNISEDKDTAWNDILCELEKKFGPHKFSRSSLKKVKTQWQNMKRIAREEITANGPSFDKYSTQSLEVCNILNLINETVGNTATLPAKPDTAGAGPAPVTANVEIKTEVIDDEDMPEDVTMIQISNISDSPINQYEPKPSTSAAHVESTAVSDVGRIESNKPTNKNIEGENSFMQSNLADEFPNINPLHRGLNDFFRFTAIEKQLKLETLREERQIVKTMKETAELNKIIAEQRLRHLMWVKQRQMAMYSGEPGSGAGSGGGGGGSIREAGGAFGKMEAAREGEYFYKKQKEQLENLKNMLDKEITFHEEQIKHHAEAIKRHRQQQSQVDKKE